MKINPNEEENNIFRVLVVEDEINTIRGTLRAIKRISTDVTNVKNITEAEIALKNNFYELLIIDVQLPNNEGGKLLAEGGISLINDVCNEVFGFKNKDTPFIILSAQERSIRIDSIKNHSACKGILGKLMHLEVIDCVRNLIEGEEEIE